jgi:hypothetical protein
VAPAKSDQATARDGEGRVKEEEEEKREEKESFFDRLMRESDTSQPTEVQRLLGAVPKQQRNTIDIRYGNAANGHICMNASELKINLAKLCK